MWTIENKLYRGVTFIHQLYWEYYFYAIRYRHCTIPHYSRDPKAQIQVTYVFKKWQNEILILEDY